MSTIPNLVLVRLAQIKGEFLTDGYRQTGKIGDSVYALKHTNGNRITLIATPTSIAIMKNGRLIKTDEVTRAAAAAASPSPATSSTYKNPKSDND